MASPANPVRPKRVRLWPWAALLILVAAGAAALWVERARLAPATHMAAARLFASKELTPPPADTPAPAPRRAGPVQAAHEAAPAALPTPAPQAPAPMAPASPPVSTPEAPAAGPAEAASKPTPTTPIAAPPAPSETPPETPTARPSEVPAETSAAKSAETPAEAPAQTIGPGSQGAGPVSATPEPSASAPLPAPERTVAEPAAPASKPDTAPAPTPTSASAPAPAALPTESDPQAPAAAAPVRKDWQVVIYYHSASLAAEAEAARLTAELGPLTARVNMWQANAVPHLPTIVYFHPEDAAAAQDLATLLGRPDADTTEWHVRSMPPPRTRRPPGTFEVWLSVP